MLSGSSVHESRQRAEDFGRSGNGQAPGNRAA